MYFIQIIYYNKLNENTVAISDYFGGIPHLLNSFINIYVQRPDRDRWIAYYGNKLRKFVCDRLFRASEIACSRVAVQVAACVTRAVVLPCLCNW